LLFDELGLSATIHSANTATVAARSPMSGRDACVIKVIIGTCARRHEPSRAS
jgi:hypothetical protein